MLNVPISICEQDAAECALRLENMIKYTPHLSTHCTHLQHFNSDSQKMA